MNEVNNRLSARRIDFNKEPLANEKGLTAVLEQRVKELARIELEVFVGQIRSLSLSVGRPEQVIEEAAKKLPGYLNLPSTKGIGSLGASISLLVIGDIQDFPEEGELAAYFGIMPRVQSSNETGHSGRITKRESKLGRTTLVQCALIAKRSSSHLYRFYEQIRARRGTGTGIMVFARKFLSIISYTLKNKWIL